jgi:hypothetical protein
LPAEPGSWIENVCHITYGRPEKDKPHHFRPTTNSIHSRFISSHTKLSSNIAFLSEKI